MPGAVDLWVLGAMAFATAVLSGVIGMAGGIVLLTVMLLYFEPSVAIPIHGAIQLVSNGSRTFLQRRHVEWGLVWRYSILLLPLGFLGVQVLFALPGSVSKALIGAFVLVATWRPAWLRLGSRPDEVKPTLRFVTLGGVVGFLQVIVGATGPLIAPFFLNLGLSRQALVGTKAACQMLGHVSKLVVFGVVGFAFRDHLVPIALMTAAVVAGTWVGTRLLERVDERGFVLAYRVVLSAVALHLLLSQGLAWWTGGARLA